MTAENPEHDTTEKVEQTDVGFRLTVESTRGTGTRDEDTVKMEARTEEYPDELLRNKVASDVEEVMNRRRAHQTESED